MQITFTIPDEKASRVVDAIAGEHPIPIDPDTGDPEFTPNQWAKEYVRRFIVRIEHAWRRSCAGNAELPDNNIVY